MNQKLPSPTVYLLSVGISQYASDQISDLDAGKKDVINLQKVLIDLGYLTIDQCILLYDEQATRENIINSFRSHFSQLKDGDIAVFHYSGHGTSELTHKSFSDTGIEGIVGKNEVLVCHDSGIANTYNLADKELRLLIVEVQTQKPKCTFVGIFDCCHAGSMLKENDRKIRMTNTVTIERTLNDYLEGQYQKMLNETGTIALPDINYISLSACTPREQAWEDKEGGFFTNALIQVLQQQSSSFTYATLHSLSRAIVTAKSKGIQHPNLEYTGKVNPFQLFLDHKVSAKDNLPRLIKKGSEWIVNQGTIHGVEYPKSEQVPIFMKGDFSKAIGYGIIKTIFIEQSIVIPHWYKTPAPEIEVLFIGLYSNPVSIYLHLKSKDIVQKLMLEQLSATVNQLTHRKADQPAKYEVNAENNQLKIYRNDEDKKELLIGLKEISSRAFQWLPQQLNMIIKWENIKQLRTPNRSSIIPESIQLSFTYEDRNGNKVSHLVGGDLDRSDTIEQIDLEYQQDAGVILYQFSVSHTHRNTHGLYFYLIHLDRYYNIEQKHENYLKPLVAHDHYSLFRSKAKRVGFGIADPNTPSIEEHFVLIASEKALMSPYYFHQEGFESHYGKVIPFTAVSGTRNDQDHRKTIMNNWAVKHFRIRIKAV